MRSDSSAGRSSSFPSPAGTRRVPAGSAIRPTGTTVSACRPRSSACVRMRRRATCRICPGSSMRRAEGSRVPESEMTRPFELIVDSEPRPDDVLYLEDRIYEFNSAVTGIGDGAWLSILARNGDRIVAGICGNTWGGCLEIRQFWVEEARRRQGLGTRLFETAEREARRRGC